MSNFNGTARSNYFRVKDAAAFKAWVESLPDLRLLEQPSLDPAAIRYGIASECPDTGCFPSYLPDLEEGDEWYTGDPAYAEGQEIDYVKDLGAHLADGEVAVMMEAGAEKLRYISGWAQAFDNTGKSVHISLNDIYSLALTEFGVSPSSANF